MNTTTTSPSSSCSHYVDRGGEDEEEEEEEEGEGEEERARCEWEFHLAAVVSSSPSSSGIVGASDAIGAIDFDPSGRLIATGGIARKIRVYEVEALLSPSEGGGGGTSFKEHAGCCARCVCAPAKLSSVRWRPDGAGRVVGCGDYDGVVAEYDVSEGRGGGASGSGAGAGAAVFERDEHAGRRVWSVDYAPDGSLGASGSDDGTAHVWDARSGSGAGVGVARAGGAVCCVEFDPGGGPWVALGSADRKAYVYDLRAMGRGAAGVMEGHARAVTYVRFAGAGSVVTSAADGTHRLWDWGEGRERRRYAGHANGRRFVGMGLWRGGGLVGSGSETNEVFVHDLRWKDPIWVRGFGGCPAGPVDAAAERVFVSSVCWRQNHNANNNNNNNNNNNYNNSNSSSNNNYIIYGDNNAGKDEAGLLVAGGSNGVLQVFVCRRKEELN